MLCTERKSEGYGARERGRKKIRFYFVIARNERERKKVFTQPCFRFGFVFPIFIDAVNTREISATESVVGGPKSI